MSASCFVIHKAPTDPLFGLMAKCKADNSEHKVDLGVGAYRDNQGKPWVLPVVKKVSLASLLSPLSPAVTAVK